MTFLLRLLASVSLTLAVSTVSAMSFTFSLIDSSEVTPIVAPSFTASGISFVGTNAAGSLGAYTAPIGGGSPSIIPSAGFSSLGSPSGGRGVYRGTSATGDNGLYTNVGGSLVQLGGTAGFTRIGNPDDADGTVAFAGNDGNNDGIFTTEGTDNTPPATVADETTEAPGQAGETFSEFGDPSTDDGEVAFKGTTGSESTSKSGIYVDDGNGLELIADGDTAVPDDSGSTFESFSDPSLDNGQVAFSATDDAGGSGVYVQDATGSLNEVVDGGSEGLSNIGAPVLDNGDLAFTATDDNGTDGLYVVNSGVLETVLQEGDSLGDSLAGQTVTSILLGPNGVQGDSLAILAGLSGGGSVIVIATADNAVGALGPLPAAAPVPTSLALFVLGLALLGYRRGTTG